MSISANIAEGRTQKTDKDFVRFLGYALSSTSEVEHHLIVARDTGAFTEADYVELLSETVEVRKMLYGLIRTVSASKPPTEEDASSSS